MSSGGRVNELRTELLQVSPLVDEQASAGMDRTELISSHFESMLSMGAGLNNITSTDVLALTKASNNGPWNDYQKKELGRIFNARKCEAQGKKKKNGLTQKCLWFENMLPTAKMAMVRSKRLSRLSRAQVIAECARDIGIHSPEENTLFRMVSLLFWGELNHDLDDDDDRAFTQQEVFDWMNKIQAFIKAKSSTKHADLPFIIDYPVSADLLPNEIKACYGGEVPPDVVIPQLDTILADKNKRGNDVRKRTSTGAEPSQDPTWMKHLSKEHREQARRDLNPVKLEQSTPKVKAEPYPMPASGSNVDADTQDKLAMLASRLKQEQLLRDNFAQRVKPDPEMKKEDKEEPKDIKLEHEGHFETGGSIDEMERNMLEATRARKKTKDEKATVAKLKKRPAGSCDPTPHPKKKPAIAKAAAKETHTTIKTFSKAALNLERKIDMTSVMKEVKARIEQLDFTPSNRNKVTSQAYAAGVRFALTLKAKEEIAKKFGRMQLSKASAMWNKYHCG
jgi:hypothetical protein